MKSTKEICMCSMNLERDSKCKKYIKKDTLIMLFDFVMITRKDSFRRKVNKDNKQPRKYELIDILGLIN